MRSSKHRLVSRLVLLPSLLLLDSGTGMIRMLVMLR